MSTFASVFASTSYSISFPSPSSSPPLSLATVKFDQWIRPFEMLVTPCMTLVDLKNEFNPIFRPANEPL